MDVPNYNLLVEEAKTEQNKPKKTEEVEHKENPYYTRYVLQVRDNTFQRSEEEFNAANAPKFVNQNPDYNKGNEGTPSNLTDKQLKMHLEKAAKFEKSFYCQLKYVRCFRNAVLVTKKKRARQQKEQTVQIKMSYQGTGIFIG